MLLSIARSAIFLVGFVVQSRSSTLGTGGSLVHFVLLLHFVCGFFLTKLLFGFQALVDINQSRENKAVGKNLLAKDSNVLWMVKNIFCEEQFEFRIDKGRRARVINATYKGSTSFLKDGSRGRRRKKKSDSSERYNSKRTAKSSMDPKFERSRTSLPQSTKLRRVKIMVVVCCYSVQLVV